MVQRTSDGCRSIPEEMVRTHDSESYGLFIPEVWMVELAEDETNVMFLRWEIFVIEYE